MAVLLLAAGVTTARAEDPPPEGALTLGEVVQATLGSNPDIQAATQQVEAARGALTSAGTTFDTHLVSDGGAGRMHGTDPLRGLEAIQKQLSYRVALERLFRNGITVTPEVGLVRNSFSTLPGSAASNAGSVALTVAVPLMRDRGGESSVAAERAAGHDYAARRLALRHTRAATVLSSVVAYWDYLAAQERLDVLRSSEDRARRIAEQTRVLVQAEERTATDLTQTLGNLAAKRVTRIAAEQGLVEARQQLGLAVGWPAETIPALPAAGTTFPEPPVQAAAASTADLFSSVLARRADFGAAEEELAAAESQVGASRSELKPRLDLLVTGGYRSSEPGLGFNDFFSPLYRRGPRPDATFQFRYTLPVSNSYARGLLLQTSALSEQRRLARDDLKRRIASGVVVASEALARGQAGVRESAEAVRLLEATVQAEQRKFQLGVATLFDVIQAEDALTNARLGQIQSRRNYAAAIAATRFQTGTLLAGGEGEPAAVDTAALQSP